MPTTNNDGGVKDLVDKFTITCGECGSIDCEIYHEFNYYGGATGYDITNELRCNNCENVADLG